MRILVIHKSFPETDRHSGALRLFEIIRCLCQNGNDVTFLAMRGNETKYRSQLEELGVKCQTDEAGSLSRNLNMFASVLRAGDFEVAILSHYFVYNRYAKYLRAILPQCRCIVDTVDLHSVRKKREAELGLATLDEVETVRKAERAAIQDSDQVWVVTATERDTVSDLGWSNRESVHVVPNIHQIMEDPPGYDARSGIVFLGGYRHRPNVDAIEYFMDRMYQEVRCQLPAIDIYIAGSDPTDELLQLPEKYPGVRVTGFVEDHRALLATCRVAIAPLRYGAGMKGKLGEYLSCGLPCVSTSIGTEGMGLSHGVNVLVTDNPSEFVMSIVQLYGDRELWERLSAAGADYIDARYSASAIGPIVLSAIAAAQASVRRPSARWPSKLLGLAREPSKFPKLMAAAWRSVRQGGMSELRERFFMWLNRYRT